MGMLLHNRHSNRVVDDRAEREISQPIVEVDEPTTTGEVSDTKQYSKTEIQRLSTSELQKLAYEQGFADAYETSGNQLKKRLVEHFGL